MSFCDMTSAISEARDTPAFSCSRNDFKLELAPFSCVGDSAGPNSGFVNEFQLGGPLSSTSTFGGVGVSRVGANGCAGSSTGDLKNLSSEK